MLKHVRGLCVGVCFFIATQSAFGLYMTLGSPKGIPYESTYPRAAVLQVYSALTTEGCKLVKGHAFNSSAQMQFAGDTDTLNQMLKRIADCPTVSVTVSFRELDQPGDWVVDYECHAMSFQVTVNLRSKNIALDRLKIPAAKGPQLESPQTPPAKG